MSFSILAVSLSIFMAQSQASAPPPQNEAKPPAKAETSAPAKQEATAAPAPAKKPKKVWTTDDLDGKAPRTKSDTTEAANFEASNSSKAKQDHAHSPARRHKAARPPKSRIPRITSNASRLCAASFPKCKAK